MPIGKTRAERLALKLHHRCMGELISKNKSWKRELGDTFFAIGDVVTASEEGSYEFIVEEREVGRFQERRNWEVLVMVSPDLEIIFAEKEPAGGRGYGRFPKPPPWDAIADILSCASRGPD